MMGVSIRQIWFSSLAVVSLGAACGSSKTADQISVFADKMCACTDAACATAVESEYFQWWEQNQRARGGEGDRKDVEKSVQRIAQCHLKYVTPEPSRTPVTVPKVDLEPPARPPIPAQKPVANEIAPEAKEGDSAKGKGETPATKGASEAPKAAPEATKDDPATP